jgi:hypothetical protein
MIEFTTDVSGFSPEKLDQWILDHSSDVLDEVAQEAVAKWRELAEDSGLTSTKDLYLEGIGVVRKLSATHVEIDLKGFLPNALESGIGSFDMKPGLLKGKDHVVIPIKHAAPGQGKALRLSELPAQVAKKAQGLRRGERYSTKLGKSKYEGMQKAKRQSGGSSYVQFRTVSVNSPSDSWIYPGLEPLNLAEKVRKHIEDNMDDIVRRVERKED